jgi:prepilin-type N-terminal cleavage/methylation domain-containing protein
MRNERGFTLIETLITITIMGILAVVLGTVVQQMAAVPEKGNDQVEALHAVQNAVHWVGTDAVSAQSAIGGSSLVLTFPDSSVITYEKQGNDLYRYSNGENISIARSITQLNFTVSNRTITMDITAAPESQWNISENQVYQVVMRPSGT